MLPILHALQEEFGYMRRSCRASGRRRIEYLPRRDARRRHLLSRFPPRPPGRQCLKLCRAEACQSMGADPLVAHAQTGSASISARPRRWRVTLEPVYCLGLCALSPSAMLEGASWRARREAPRRAVGGDRRMTAAASHTALTRARSRWALTMSRRRSSAARGCAAWRSRSSAPVARAPLAGADGRGGDGCEAVSPTGRSARMTRGIAGRRNAGRRRHSLAARLRRGYPLAQAPDAPHLRALRHRRSALAHDFAR